MSKTLMCPRCGELLAEQANSCTFCKLEVPKIHKPVEPPKDIEIKPLKPLLPPAPVQKNSESEKENIHFNTVILACVIAAFIIYAVYNEDRSQKQSAKIDELQKSVSEARFNANEANRRIDVIVNAFRYR